MEKTIVISGHGTFASGFKGTIEFVLGKQENFHYIDFNECNTDNLNKKYINILENNKNVIFFTDIAGGTPFNTIAILKEKYPELKLISGCNLSLIFSAIENDDISTILKEGIEGITLYKKQNINYYNTDETGI